MNSTCWRIDDAEAMDTTILPMMYSVCMYADCTVTACAASYGNRNTTIKLVGATLKFK